MDFVILKMIKKPKEHVTATNHFFFYDQAIDNLGIQIRNMKMVFNFYCTWRWVTFEKLMMKIYDFFKSAKSFSHPV